MSDVFISHASEDKKAVARPLAQKLRDEGVDVWYDDFALKLGDSLRQSIDHGLTQSRYGVVILSENFFAKKWPQRELDALFALEQHGQQRVLPVLHGLSQEDATEYAPLLGNKVSISTEAGLDTVVDRILEVVLAPPDQTAIERVENTARASRLVERTEKIPQDMAVGLSPLTPRESLFDA